MSLQPCRARLGLVVGNHRHSNDQVTQLPLQGGWTETSHQKKPNMLYVYAVGNKAFWWSDTSGLVMLSSLSGHPLFCVSLVDLVVGIHPVLVAATCTSLAVLCMVPVRVCFVH